ncbi:MAG: hypothetical protein ACI4N4_07085 [Candidatus Fimenecus sp.]
MIYYKPITDKVKLAQLFKLDLIAENAVFGGYIGYDESNNEVGKCLVKITGYNCFVTELDCDYSDKLLTEGFVRAALNFGANRNAYMAYCSLEEIKDVLTLLGFENNNDIYEGDIPTLLKGSCCKKSGV